MEYMLYMLRRYNNRINTYFVGKYKDVEGNYLLAAKNCIYPEKEVR